MQSYSLTAISIEISESYSQQYCSLIVLQVAALQSYSLVASNAILSLEARSNAVLQSCSQK